MDKFKVGNSDLNLVDANNGTATLSYKEFVPLDLVGAFGLLNGNLGTGSNGDMSNFLQNRLIFIHQMRNEIINFVAEMWDYKNLPPNFNKYDLETALNENGSVAFFRWRSELVFAPYNTIEKDIFDNPIKIRIISTGTEIDNLELVADKFSILKNNRHEASVMLMSLRWLHGMEKCVYQLEKNLTSSAPKGLIVNNGMKISTGENTSKSDSFNSIINGEDTFYEMTLSDINEGGSLLAETPSQIFVPIELEDRTESLIRNYNFYKEQIKELFGFDLNNLMGKKERLITDEVDIQQGISELNRVHMFEIRKLGVDYINKKFGTNIVIEDKETKNAEVEGGEELVNNQPGERSKKETKSRR